MLYMTDSSQAGYTEKLQCVEDEVTHSRLAFPYEPCISACSVRRLTQRCVLEQCVNHPSLFIWHFNKFIEAYVFVSWKSYSSGSYPVRKAHRI